MRKIKLIWDFRGPASAQTAIHHEKHLRDYAASEHFPEILTGNLEINEMHAIAFLVVDESDMIKVRDSLKPHRGEVYIL